jgi:hypothetical protein
MKLYQALIAGLVACSFAVADSTSTTTTTTTKTTKAAPVCKVKGDASKQIWGKVVSVDAISSTIIITPKGKKTDDTISTTDSTVVMPKGTMLSDIKTDDKVAVSYKIKDGKMVACKITAKPVKKPAAPAAAPATK